jgi:acyl-CoA thioesterase YciA
MWSYTESEDSWLKPGSEITGAAARDDALPRGELASRVLAMPTDTNPKGDIFGGWIMSLMDMAGKMSATTVANGRVVTVAVDRIVFRQPVRVGDVVCCYTEIVATGRSSITLSIEVWVMRQGKGERLKVTDATFTFVAVDEEGRPRPLPQALPPSSSLSADTSPSASPSRAY